MVQGQTRESVKMAFDTLRANKLRSGLTILGIVIGVTTVIAISSIISGLNNRIADFANSMGTNTIWVFHLPFGLADPTPEQLNRKKLTIGDVVALRDIAACAGRRWLASARKAHLPRGRRGREVPGEKSGRDHPGRLNRRIWPT